MNVSLPKFRSEWNLNTMVVLVGFASGFVAWGYTISDMQAAQEENKNNLTKLNAQVSANETELRRLDNHELRITNIEKTAADSAQTMKSLDKSINELSSDMRVVREILQRIEAGQNH